MKRILITALLGMLPGITHAQLNYVRIARTGDSAGFPVPGTTTPFQSVVHPSTDGDNVVFWGSNTSQHEGIYAWDGNQLIRIADRTSRPDDKLVTNFYQDPTVISGRVTFGAFRGGQDAYAGLFEAAVEADPSAWNIVDTEDFVDTELGDGTYHLEPQGISNGSTTVMKLTHFQPGGENFGQKHTGIFDSQPGDLNNHVQVVLHPESTVHPLNDNTVQELSSFDDDTFGLLLEYLDPDTFSTIRRVAGFHYFDFAAGGTGFLHIMASEGDSPGVLQGESYSRLFAPAISGGWGAFVAQFGGKQGILIQKASPTSIGALKIVDTDTTVPGTAFKFASFHPVLAYERRSVLVDAQEYPAFDGYRYFSETVVFTASIDDGIFFGNGLFMWQNGVLTSLILPGDVIAGSSRIDQGFVYSSFQFSSRALLGGRLTFKVDDAVNQLNGMTVDEIFSVVLPPAPFTGGFPPGTTRYNATSGMCFDFVGRVGDSYQVEYSDVLPPKWTPLTNFTYTVPVQICDPDTNPTRRIYQTVAQ